MAEYKIQANCVPLKIYDIAQRDEDQFSFLVVFSEDHLSSEKPDETIRVWMKNFDLFTDRYDFA